MNLKPIASRAEWHTLNRLYRRAFPKAERKPLFLIKRKYSRHISDVWVLEQDGDFFGFVITLNAADLVMVDYFAICDDRRGNGCGSEALRLLQEHYDGRRLFLEIESVYDKQAENLPERLRRKKFYCRNNMQELGVLTSLFGIDMELLGYNCDVTFEEYYQLYYQTYGTVITKHVHRLDFFS